MKRKATVTVSMLADVFGRALHAPKASTQPGRIELIDEGSLDLLAGKMPTPEAAVLIGKAFQDWLEGGGDLVRDHLQVAARRGSHSTPTTLWKQRRHRR